MATPRKNESSPVDSNSSLSRTDHLVNKSKLVRKLDLRILPFLTVIYVLSFIDRVNIGNALLFGLRGDLGISNNEYSTALSIFFVSYIIFEIPANVLMKKLKPSVFLTACVFAFGLLVICQGFCENLSSLLAIRFLLGVAEAGTLPGCIYIMSMWYTREEAQRRFTFFYNGASIAGAFGGLLASAIGNLDYHNGHRGWKWIFWIEGGVTCFIALFGPFLIVDFPETTKWLSQDERSFLINRLALQQGASKHEEAVTLRAVARCFKDWHMIPLAVMYFGPACALYSLAYFIPSIVSSYGYSPVLSQLWSVPPWAATFVWSMLIAYFSDKSRLRSPFVATCLILAIVGGIALAKILPLPGNRDARYACLCLYLMGAFTTGPLAVCWNVMNKQGHLPRAVSVAWQISFGNIAGIVAAWIFPDADRPRYLRGYYVGIGCLAASLVAAGVYGGSLIRINSARRRVGEQPLYL